MKIEDFEDVGAPHPLKIQVILLFQLVQTQALLLNGRQSDTRSEEEASLILGGFLSDGALSNTLAECIYPVSHQI